MIKRLLFSSSKSITGAAIILSAASLLSRIIGLLRDRVFAHYFGAGDVLDAYYAAFRVPDLVYNLLIVGALSAGFIPVFVDVLTHSKEKAWRLTNNVITVLGILLIIVSGLLAFFTPHILPYLFPGFEKEKMELTILFTRIMFVSPILLGISSVVSSVLQSFKNFLVYALSPIFYNIGIIFGVIVLVPYIGISGLAWGVVLGALLHLIVQIPTLLQHGYRFKWAVDLKNTELKTIFKLIIPRTLGLATQQINFLVIVGIASTLSAGSVAVFNLAHNLQQAPIGIIGYSFTIAAFPTLVTYIAEKKIVTFTTTLANTVKQVLFLIIPITFIILLLRAQIVRVILGTGAFDWNDTIATSNALAFFSLSLFAQSLITLLARAFHALKNTAIPFVVSIVMAGLNIIAALYFKNLFGVAGIAFAFSIAAVVQFALLWLLLRYKVGSLHEFDIIKSLSKISIAAIMMGGTMQLLKLPISLIVDMTTFWGIFLQAGTTALIGLLVYIGICSLLKVEAYMHIQESVKKRWLRLRNIQGEIHGPDEM